MAPQWLFRLFARTSRTTTRRRYFLPSLWRRKFLRFDELETRVTPSFTGGVYVAAGDVNGDRFADIVTGPGAGYAPQVRVVSGGDGADLYNLFPYESSFTGGVQVAVGDVNKDGAADILVGTGVGGSPRVQVLSGRDGKPLTDFFAYEDSFRGGVQVAAGDVNGDGFSDIITGTAAGGGPRVRVVSGKDGEVLSDFFAYEDSFRGGVFVSAGDVDGDGYAEIITGTGVGGGPRVRAFGGKDGKVVGDFFAYEDSFRGGVLVSSADVDGDGHADYITGTGPGGGPRVRVLSGDDGAVVYDGFAYEDSFRGGVFVASADFTADGKSDLVFGTGQGGGPRVRAVDSVTGETLADYFAYDPGTSPGGFSKEATPTPTGPDTTAPTVKINSPPALTNKNPTVTGTVADDRLGVAAEVKVDGGAYAATAVGTGGAITFTPTLAVNGSADGSHTLTFRARDVAGNLSPATTVAFTLDTIAPSVSLQLDAASDTAPVGDNKTTLGTVVLVGTTEPGLTVRLGADGPAVTADLAGSFRFTAVALAVGVNPFTVFATDPAGNAGSAAASITRTETVATPTVSVGLANDTAPGGGPNNDGITFDPTVTGTAMAPAGLTDLKASVGAGAFVSVLTDAGTDGKYTLNPSRLEQIAGAGLADGPVTVRVQAFDALGKSSEVAVLTFTLDRAAPPTPAVTLPGGSVTTSAVVVNLIGTTEAGAFVRLGAAGALTAAGANGSFLFQDVPLVDGANAFTVIAYDAAGNTASGTSTITRVNVSGPTDTPTLAAASNTGRNPAANVTKFSTPTIVVTAPAGENVEFFVDGASVGTVLTATSGVATIALPTQADGIHTITARRLGGQMSNPLTIAVDATAPPAVTLTLSAGSQSGGPLTTTAAVVNLVGTTEKDSIVTLTGPGLSGLSSAAGTFTLPNVALALGANAFTVTVTDAAGNVSTFTPAAITRLASTGQQDAVGVWISNMLLAVQGDASTPPVASRTMAMTAGAMYDAVSAVEGRAGYFVTRTAAATTSLDAAVAAAAHRVLAYTYPVQQTALDAQLAASLTAVPNGPDKDAGVALGQSIADAIIALRETDGYQSFATFVPAADPGVWVPTAPAFLEGMLPQWGDVEPFTLNTGDEFQPPAPPDLTSALYTADFNEVKELGRRDSTTRTAEQTQIARFWADGAGTYTPPGHWMAIAQQAAAAAGNSLSANARLFAELALAVADAGIACWDVKYEFGFWRPITAIQQADTDGNPDTAADPDWLPLITTPNFPEYVSGHSTFSAAAAEILTETFGNNFGFSLNSIGFPGVTRNFANFEAAAAEAAISRVYGGIHYTNSDNQGLTLGKKIGQRVLDLFNVTEDVVAPKLTVVTTDGPSSKVNPSVAGRVRDFVSGVQMVTATTDGGVAFPVPVDADGNFMFTPQLALNGTADGPHTVTFAATDFAGNVSQQDFHFLLATRGPIVTVTGPSLAADLFPTAYLTGAVDFGAAPLASFKYQFETGPAYSVTAGADGSFDQFLQLSRLGTGGHTLTVTATDKAGNTNTVTRSVTLSQVIPFVVTGINPADGAENVGTTYRPQVFFSRPADLGTLNADTIWATDSAGTRIQAKVVPTDDGTSAWLFFDGPLPGAGRVTVHADGAKIAAFDAAVLDADGDGAAGGELTFDFTTVSLASVPGTSLSGVLVDPGPDLKPFTTDDAKAGADGSLMTADDKYLLPIVGATISILGREDLTATTKADGSFIIANMPAGHVKFVIDGRTATSAPGGFYFPEMVMDLAIDSGTANTVMGSMGTDQQRAASAAIPGVYLPRIKSAVLTAVAKGLPDPVTITTNPESSQGLTPAQRKELTIQVNGNSMLGSDGRVLDGAQIGISTVDPALVREMLPPGVLQHTFDITVQAPGVDRFAVPAPMTFPNTFHVAPGTKLDFLSFDHTTGKLVIEGTATVSPDGLSVTTDPGTGVTHPGWHGLTPPGGCNNGNPPPPPPPPPKPTDTTTETEHTETLAFNNSLSFSRSWSLPKNPAAPPPPPPPPNGCPPPKPEDNKKKQLTVKIEVVGAQDKFLKKAAGATEGLGGGSFTVKPGDKEHTFAVEGKTFVEMFGANGLGAKDKDALYGTRIKITETMTNEDGSVNKTISVHRLYLWADVVDANAALAGGGGTAVFNRGFVGIARTKEVDLFVPGPDNLAFEGSDGQFDYSGKSSWQFTGGSKGVHTDTVGVKVTDPKFGTLTFGSKLSARARASDTTKIAVDIAGYRTEFARVLTQLAATPGGDGQAGAKNVDDDGNGTKDDATEYGWPGTDDVVTYADSGANSHTLTNAFRTFTNGYFHWQNPAPAALNAFLQTQGDALFAAIQKDYAVVGGGYTVDAGTAGDVTLVWQDRFTSSGAPAYGSAAFDRDDAALRPLIAPSVTKVGKAAKQWALMEYSNRRETGDTGGFGVGINVDWNNRTSFANYVANTVSHEIAHTFGLNDSYDDNGKRYTPFDLMMNGNGNDPNLTFAGNNIQLLRAAIGKQGTGPTPITSGFDLAVQIFNLPTVPAPLTRTGVPPGTADVAYIAAGRGDETTFLGGELDDFGTVVADGAGGVRAEATYSLYNGGTAPLTLADIRLANGAGGFALAGLPADGTAVAPGEAVTIGVVFDPTAAGTATDRIIIDNDSANAPTFTLNLTGTGTVNAGVARLDLGNNNLGGAAVGQTVAGDAVASVTNLGGTPLSITGVTVVAGQGFTLTNVPANIGTVPVVLAPGATLTFGGTFTADALGLRRGEVRISTSDPAAPTVTVGLVGTGLPDVVYPAWGADYIGVDDGAGGFPVRDRSDAAGNFSIFLPSDRDYRVVVFDPATGLVGTGYGRTLPSGQGSDLSGSLVFAASTAPDTDGDGLPDDVEFAIGSGVKNRDSNRDGIDDFSAVQQGLNPLGDPLPIGVIASLPLAGDAKAVVTVGSATDSDGQTAYLATGTGGLAIVDATRFAAPVVLSQTVLPGEAADVAVDAARGVAVVAAGFPGVHFVDVTDPANPVLTQTVATPYAASAVEVYDGTVYVANGRNITALDARTGEFYESVTLAGSVVDLAREGTMLYALDSAARIRVIDLGDFAMTPRGTVTVGVGTKLSVGNGIGYVATGTQAGGYSTVDLSNPDAPALISGPDVNPADAHAGAMIVPNGSGLGVAVGGVDFVFGGFKGLDLFDVRDPADTGKFGTRIAMPELPTAVALGAGIAYVADGTGGLQVVNYLQFDADGLAPTVKVSTPGTAGPTVIAGSSVSVIAAVADDVQVRNVELLVNGVVVANNVALPYDFAATVPAFAAGGPNPFTVVVRATDTGGNVAVSTPISYTVVADTAPPVAVGSSPNEGGSVYYTPHVDVRYDKPLDAAALAAGGIVLTALDAGGVPTGTVAISKIDLLSRGRRIAVYPAVALATGKYSLTVPAAAVVSRGGVQAASAETLNFEVRTASDIRAASGVPAIPNAPAANPLQDVALVVPWEPALTRATFATDNGTAGIYTVTPTVTDPASQKATVTVPNTAATGDLVVYGAGGYDVTRLPNWVATSGTVDVYGEDAAGGSVFDPQPGNGLYVNLATYPDYARLESKADLSLSAGQYTLTFDLAGSYFGGNHTVTVSLGDAFTEDFSRTSNAPFTGVSRTVTVPADGPAKLAFQVVSGSKGGSGPLLDNVKLVRVADGKELVDDAFDLTLPDSPIPLQIVPVLESGFLYEGSAYRGGSLSLSGLGFVPGQSSVTIGGVTVAPSYNGYNTYLTVTVPAGAPSGPINVVTNGGTSLAFPQRFEDLAAAPTTGTGAVNTSPAANAGQAVTLTGSGFDAETSVVFRVDNGFSGKQAEYIVRPVAVAADGSSAVVVVPDAAVTGPVEVVGDQLGAAFELQIVPVVKAARLNYISGGFANITLTGTGFTEDAGTYTFGTNAVTDTDTEADVYFDTVTVNVPVAGGLTGAITVANPGGVSAPFSLGALTAVGTALSGTPANAGVASANPGQSITLTGAYFDVYSYVQATYPTGGGATAVRTLYPQAIAPDGSSASYEIPADFGGVVALALAGAANDAAVQVVPFVTQVTGSPGANLTVNGRGFVDDVPSNYDVGGANVAEPTTDIQAYWYAAYLYNLPAYNAGGTLVVHTAAGSSAPVPVAGVPVPGAATVTAVVAAPAAGTAANAGLPGANVGQVVTVVGTNFDLATQIVFPTRDPSGTAGTTAVTVQAVSADGTAASVRVPDYAATGPVAAVDGTGAAALQIVPTISRIDGRPSDARFNIVGSGFMYEQMTLTIGGVTPTTPTLDRTGGYVGGANTSINNVYGGFVLDGDVTVSTPGGTFTLPAAAYDPPAFVEFSGLAAAAGRGTAADAGAPAANPGQAIVLTGRGFNSQTVVLFPARDAGGALGVVSVTGTASSDKSQLTVDVPAIAVTGAVRVVGAAGAGEALQIVPLVRAVGGSVTPGSTITVEGAGLLTGGLTVTVDGIAAGVVPGSGLTIAEQEYAQQILSVVVPAGATAGKVAVATVGGTASGVLAGTTATTADRTVTFDAGSTLGSATEHLIAADTGFTLTGGSLLTPADVDIYRVALSGGDRLYAKVTPTDAKLAAAALRLFDAAGKDVAYNYGDDTLEWLEVPAAGNYFVGVAGSGNYYYDPLVAGSGTGLYSTAGAYKVQFVRRAAGTSTLTGIAAGPGSGTAARAGTAGANVGQTVTLTGTGLSLSDSVSFTSESGFYYYGSDPYVAETTAYPTAVAGDGKSLTVVVPAGAVTGRVRLSRESAGVVLQIVPVIGDLDQGLGDTFHHGGLAVTGTGFSSGHSIVGFGASARAGLDYYSYNGTTISLTVPLDANTGPVTVTTPGGTSAAFGPTFTGISTTVPTTGTAALPGNPAANPGQAITLTGTGFDISTDVVFKLESYYGGLYEYVVRPLAVAPDGTSAVVVVPTDAVTATVGVVGDSLGSQRVLQIVPVVTGAWFVGAGADATAYVIGTGFVEDATTYAFGANAVADGGPDADDNNTYASVEVPYAAGLAGPVTVTTAGGTSAPFTLGPVAAVATAQSGTASGPGAAANPGQAFTLTGSNFTAGSSIVVEFDSGPYPLQRTILYPEWVAPDGSAASYDVPYYAGGIMTVSAAGAAAPVTVRIVPVVTQVTGSPGTSLTLSGLGFVDGPATSYDIGGLNVPDTSTDQQAYYNAVYLYNLGAYNPAGTLVAHTAGGSSAPVPVAGVPVAGSATVAALNASASFGTPAAGGPAANVDETVEVVGTDFTLATQFTFPTRDNAGRTTTVNVTAQAVSADGTRALVRVPGTATTGAVSVVGGTGSALLQIVPTLAGLTGRPGDTVFTLIGSGFMRGETTITVGGLTVLTPTVDDAGGYVSGASNDRWNDLTAPLAVDGPITLTTPGGSVTLGATTYAVPPFIEFAGITAAPSRGTAAAPAAPAAVTGDTITLTGRGFTTTTVVLFPARDTSPGVGKVGTVGTPNADGTKLTVMVPDTAVTGQVVVLGATGGGTALQVVPVIHAAGGPLTPGSTLTLDGSGLVTGDLAVTVDGIAATVGTLRRSGFLAQDLVDVTVPFGVSAGVVTVTTAGGTFSYRAAAGAPTELPDVPVVGDPGSKLSTATAIAVAADTTVLFTGAAVDSPTDADLFKIDLSGGDDVTFFNQPAGGVPYSTLRLYDAAGKLVASNYGGTYSLEYTAPAAGTYYVAMTGDYFIEYDPVTGVVGSNSFYTGTYTLGVTRVSAGTTTLTGIVAALDSGTAARAGVPAVNTDATITLTGTGLTASDTVVFKAVYYGTGAMTDITVSPDSVAGDGLSLTVTVPDAAVTGTVRLYRETAGLFLQIVPVVAEVTASGAFRGGYVSVTGTGLASGSVGTGRVYFGATAASGANYYYTGNTYAYAGVAFTAPSGPVTVATAGGTSAAFDRTFTGLSTNTASVYDPITVFGTGLTTQTSVVFRVLDYYYGLTEVVVTASAAAGDGTSATVNVPYNAVTGLIEVVGDKLGHTELLTIV